MALYLIAQVAGETVAMPTDAIGSVVELGAIVPVPRAAPHVAGLCALRSRVLTVIDARAALGLSRAPTDAELAVIVDVAGHGYALAVDRVEDVVDGPAPEACAAALDGAWSRIARGMVEIEGRPLLLVDPVQIVEEAETSSASELTRC